VRKQKTAVAQEKHMPYKLRLFATLGSFFLLVLLLGAYSPQDQASTSENQPQAAADKDTHNAGDYVGSETCIGCHEDSHNLIKETPMGRVMLAHPRTAEEKLGCESCHGPGKTHAESPSADNVQVRFTKDSKNTAAEKNASCLNCHSRGERMFWQGSPHQMRNMACVDCHTVHFGNAVTREAERKLSSKARFSAPLSDHAGMKMQQPELCLTCHKMRRAQLQRSSHMPYREGKVVCASCHNPHGSPNPSQLKHATINENCLSCHTERRGPFVWEHPPVMENCANCHEAHGSNNPQMLKVRMPRVCESCHVTQRHPTTPQPLQSVRNFGRGCTNCHSAIHGSNHPSGNAFLR
jgi:DmsE family decaheme c-type cytochrome